MCIGQAMVTQRAKAPPILLLLGWQPGPLRMERRCGSLLLSVKMLGGHAEPANTAEISQTQLFKNTLLLFLTLGLLR